MIQIRKKNGEVVPVEEGCFVELLNIADNSIGSVFFTRQRGTIVQIMPGSHDAHRYSQLFGVSFTEGLINRDLRQTR